MPIKFNIIERGQPGVAGGGEKKYYASAKMDGEVTLAGLTREIEKISTVSGADIRAVLYALVDVITGSLGDGKIIRLAELGSLRVSISSDGRDTATEVNAAAVRNAKVIFTPGKQIRDMLGTLQYQKI